MAPFIVDEEEEREDRDDEAADDEHNHNQALESRNVKIFITKEI